MKSDKINRLIKAIVSNNRESAGDDMKLIEDFASSCGRYLKATIELEAARSTARYYLDGEEYRRHIEDLEKACSNAQNSLVAAVKIINRLCEINEVEMIYTGSEDDRITQAEFVFETAQGYFNKRKNN